jgi:hypothetical protein
LSHERSDIAGAEGFHSLEGNMCGTAMRGAVALLGSRPHHVQKDRIGTWEISSLTHWPCLNGPRREGEEPTPAMYGDEKSDRAIVAMKLANKVEQSVAESVERRARAKGGCNPMPHARRTQRRRRCTKRWTAYGSLSRHYPRWEPYTGKSHVRFWRILVVTDASTQIGHRPAGRLMNAPYGLNPSEPCPDICRAIA